MRKTIVMIEVLLSHKIGSNEKIKLVEGGEIIKTDQANAKVLNNFFSNIISILKFHNTIK